MVEIKKGLLTYHYLTDHVPLIEAIREIDKRIPKKLFIVKKAIKCATTEELANVEYVFEQNKWILRGTQNGSIPTIDGVNVNLDDRILIKDQSNKYQNGIYVVKDVGSDSTPFILERADDLDEDNDFIGNIIIPVEKGNVNSSKTFTLISDNVSLIQKTDIEFDELYLVPGGKVEVSGTDKEPGYLSEKIIAGNNVTIDIVGDPGNQRIRISSIGGTVQELFKFPVKIGEITLGTAVLPANSTYIYSLDLGDTYEAVLLRNLRWVSGRGLDKSIPGFNFGVASFSSEPNLSVLVAGQGQARRLFQLTVPEYRNGQLVDAKLYDKSQDKGVLGYGSLPKDVFLDHINVFGKRVTLEDVYLDGTYIKFVVRNEENEDLVLDEYDAVSLKYITTAAPNAFRSTLCIGDSIIVGNYEIDLYVSTDGGESFTRYPGILGRYYSNISGYIDGNDIFVAFFVSYLYDTIKIATMANLDINTLTEYTITHEYNPSFNYGYGHKFSYRKDSIYFISFFNYCPRIYHVNNDFSGIVEKFRVYGSELFPDAIEGGPQTGYVSGETSIYQENDNLYAKFIYATGSNDHDRRFGLIKSTDGGNTWTKIMTHPEFVYPTTKYYSGMSREPLFYVRDDILFVAFVQYYYPFETPPDEYYFKIQANISLDGGNAWLRESGNWIAFGLTADDDRFNASLRRLFIYPSGTLLALVTTNSRVYGFRLFDAGARIDKFVLERTYEDIVTQFVDGNVEYASNVFAAFLLYKGYEKLFYIYHVMRQTEFANFELWGIK